MIAALQRYLQNYAISRTRNTLLTMSERQLEDAGISRALLLQGVKHWPWREEQLEKATEQPAKADSAEIRNAIKELSAMSDRELWDMGIHRGSIRQAVEAGMPDRPRAA